MKGQIFNPGQPQKKESFDNSQDSHEEGIRERSLDLVSAGIFQDSQLLAESVPFEINPDGGLTIRVGTGIAAGKHDVSLPEFIDASDYSKTGGERILVPAADVASGKNYRRSPGSGPGTGTGTGPFKESPDGLGGWVSTPESTWTRAIPVTDGIVNYVWIGYQYAIDPSIYSLHKVNASQKLYTQRMDGYDIVLTTSSTPPSGDPKYELLGTVDMTGGVHANVVLSQISMSGRTYAAVRPKRVNFRYDPASLAPTSVPVDGTDISLETFLNAKGSGTVTIKNIFGLTLADLGFTEDVDLKTHRLKHHSNGLIVPSDTSTSTAMYPRTDNSTPVPGDAGMVFLKKLATDETALVNGSVFNNDKIDLAYKLTSPVGGAATGDYYISFGTSNPAGIYGIVAKQSGNFLVFEKRISPYSFNSETEYLVCEVEWDGTTFINPIPPSVQTDKRLFGSISVKDIQRDAVETASIIDLAVTTDKLASSAVTSDKIANLNVTNSKLADDSVSSQKIDEADGTTGQVTTTGTGVKSGHIQSDAITSSKVDEADGTTGQNTAIGSGIKTNHIQDDAIISQKLAEWDGASTASQPNTGSGVATAHIKDAAVTAAKLGSDVAASFGFGNSMKSNLKVESLTASTVSVTADTLSVQGGPLSSVSVTIDITTSGANGLDAGSEASSTWYAIFVITNASGSLVAGLLSLSSTSPALPGGYTKFRRVGWVRNNASSDFLQFYQRDQLVKYIDPSVNLFSWSASVTTTLSVAGYLPPTSALAQFLMTGVVNASSSTGSSGLSAAYRRGTSGTFNIFHYVTAYNFASGSVGSSAGGVDILTTTAQAFDLQIVFVFAGGATGIFTLNVVGYIDPV